MQTYGKTDLPIVQLKGGIRGTLYLPFFLFKQCVGPQQKVMDRRTNTAWDYLDENHKTEREVEKHQYGQDQ